MSFTILSWPSPRIFMTFLLIPFISWILYLACVLSPFPSHSFRFMTFNNISIPCLSLIRVSLKGACHVKISLESRQLEGRFVPSINSIVFSFLLLPKEFCSPRISTSCCSRLHKQTLESRDTQRDCWSRVERWRRQGIHRLFYRETALIEMRNQEESKDCTEPGIKLTTWFEWQRRCRCRQHDNRDFTSVIQWRGIHRERREKQYQSGRKWVTSWQRDSKWPVKKQNQDRHMNEKHTWK